MARVHPDHLTGRHAATTRQAFTLMEMVVVIVMIGTLSTIAIGQWSASQGTTALQQAKQILASLDVRAQQIAEDQPDRAYPTDIDDGDPWAGLATANPTVTLTDGTSTGPDSVSIHLHEPAGLEDGPRDRTLLLAIDTGRDDCIIAALNLRQPPRYATGPAGPGDCTAATIDQADIAGTFTAPSSM